MPVWLACRKVHVRRCGPQEVSERSALTLPLAYARPRARLFFLFCCMPSG